MTEAFQTPEEIKAFVVATVVETLENREKQGLNGLDKELLERMVRVEEELKRIHERFEMQDKHFNTRFDTIDKRFEAVDKRFESVDKRFDRQDRNLRWLIGFTITFLSLLMTLFKFFV